MKNIFLYDLSNFKEALTSLSKFTTIKENDIVTFIKSIVDVDFLDYQECYEEFLKKFNLDINKLNVDNIELKSIHITTGNNEKAIINNGLLNLQEVLKNDTPIKRFLKDRNILIDINKKLVIYNGKEYEIKKETGFGQKNGVYRKLYEDYLINGFHCKESPVKYAGNVAYRPEFLYNLSKLIGYKNLETEWQNINSKCYLVEYKSKLENFEWFNFAINDSISKKDIDNNRLLNIKKWLIKQSIVVIANGIKEWGLPEIFSFSKFNHNIPKEDIINIKDITHLRDF